MKLLAYIKISIKGLIKELPAFLLSYSVYPIVLVLLLGYIQMDDFTPEVSQPIFSIGIVDKDSTDASNSLISFLKSDNVSKLIKVENGSKDLDYTVKIPKGYSTGLYGKNDIDIRIQASEEASTSKGNMLVSLIDDYNKKASKSLLIQKNIESLDLDIEEINTVISKIYSSSAVEVEKHVGEKTLSSYEHFSITFLGFVFIMFMTAVIASDNLEKEIGLYNRVISTGVTKFEYFNLNFVANYLMMIIINAIYIFTFRIFNFSFQGSLVLLWMIILLQSLVITLIGSLIATIFKKKYGLIITQIYMMFHVMFGGFIGNPEISKVFKFFNKYKPDVIITDTYRNYIIYNDFSYISKYALMMILFSIVMYFINVTAVKREWGIK